MAATYQRSYIGGSMGRQDYFSFVPPPQARAAPARATFQPIQLAAQQQTRSWVPAVGAPQEQAGSNEDELPKVPLWCGIDIGADNALEIVHQGVMSDENLKSLAMIKKALEDFGNTQVRFKREEQGAVARTSEARVSRQSAGVAEPASVPASSDLPSTKPLPQLSQHVHRIVYFDPEGLLAMQDNKLVGTGESNLQQLRRLQSALGANSRLVLCFSDAMRRSKGEEMYVSLLSDRKIRVDEIVQPAEASFDISRIRGETLEERQQKFAIERMKRNRCAEISAHLSGVAKGTNNANVQFVILQTWGGKLTFGFVDTLPSRELAARLIQPKDFYIDADAVVSMFRASG
ncbi:unnamed protein product [Amoebophrya sp. A25]|nr:unnamed protein product [Amoebophrya sp. A25]|eukprot:GSA25T00022212001.1